MLDEISAALFALGLGNVDPPHTTRRRCLSPLLVAGDGGFGGIATVDPPLFVRLVGLLPAIALIAAQPIHWLLQTAGDGVRRIACALLAGVLLVGAAWDNDRTYFVAFAAMPVDPMSELRRLADALPDNERAALLGVEHFLQFGGELFHLDGLDERTRNVAEPADFCPCMSP